jgi:hypothetical protein
MQVEVILSRKSFGVPRTCWNLAEVLGCLMLFSLVALEASSIAEVSSIAGRVLAREWANVFIHVFTGCVSITIYLVIQGGLPQL